MVSAPKFTASLGDKRHGKTGLDMESRTSEEEGEEVARQPSWQRRVGQDSQAVGPDGGPLQVRSHQMVDGPVSLLWDTGDLGTEQSGVRRMVSWAGLDPHFGSGNAGQNCAQYLWWPHFIRKPQEVSLTFLATHKWSSRARIRPEAS